MEMCRELEEEISQSEQHAQVLMRGGKDAAEGWKSRFTLLLPRVSVFLILKYKPVG